MHFFKLLRLAIKSYKMIIQGKNKRKDFCFTTFSSTFQKYTNSTANKENTKSLFNFSINKRFNRTHNIHIKFKLQCELSQFKLHVFPIFYERF